MYAVTFTDKNDGTEKVSRYFQTLHAARGWVRRIGKERYIAETFIYRGGEGGELIARSGQAA